MAVGETDPMFRADLAAAFAEQFRPRATPWFRFDDSEPAPFTRGVWTPYDMEVMLHHHCSFAPFSRKNAPAYPECRDKLVRLGLLIFDEEQQGLKSTKLGQALVRMWCEQPIPVETFKDPRFG